MIKKIKIVKKYEENCTLFILASSFGKDLTYLPLKIYDSLLNLFKW